MSKSYKYLQVLPAQFAENKYYELNPINEYQGNTSKVIEFWAKAEEFNNGNLISIGEGSEEHEGLNALIFGTTEINQEWKWIVNDGEVHTFQIPNSLNRLHHFAIVYNAQVDQLALVLDGNIMTESITDVALDLDQTKVKIGGNYKGIIDELRFWNGVRTLTEIREYMHYPIVENSPYGIAEGYPTNLLRYLQFDERSETPYESVQRTNITSKNDLRYIRSLIPVGAPGHGKYKYLYNSRNHFPDQVAWVTPEDNWNPQGDIMVSKLHVKPHHISGQINVQGLPSNLIIDEVIDKDYWVIQNFTASETDVSYKIKVLAPLKAIDITQPQQVKLLKRNSHLAGSWQLASQADSVVLINGNFNAHFSGLDNFSQFLIVRVAPAPPAGLTQDPNVNIYPAGALETSIYPNPVSKNTPLVIQTSESTTALELKVYDTLGRRCCMKKKEEEGRRSSFVFLR